MFPDQYGSPEFSPCTPTWAWVNWTDLELTLQAHHFFLSPMYDLLEEADEQLELAEDQESTEAISGLFKVNIKVTNQCSKWICHVISNRRNLKLKWDNGNRAFVMSQK